MTLKLHLAENGWVIEKVEKEEGENGIFVFAGDDENPVQNAHAFSSLLWKLHELMGPTESRYSEARVVISVVPGDKHVTQEDFEEHA